MRRQSLRTWVVEEFYRRRFRLQFLLLALVLVLDPLLEAAGIEGTLLDRGLAFSIAFALIGFERGQRPVVRAGITAIAIGALLAGIIGHQLLPRGEWMWIGIGAVVVVATVRRSLQPGHADSERVFAALDGYLLAGLLFGACYWLLARDSPGSFSGASSLKTRLDAMYFSFGTLATLGYGGVTPTSSAARGLTVVEAVSGQLYLAVLLARLVSLYGPASTPKS